MVLISSLIIVTFALWLIGVSLFALFRPAHAVAAIGMFASTDFINYLELGLRGLVGVAFVFTASLSPAHRLFAFIGWGLFVSAVIIAVLPRRWHAAYAQYWSKKIPPQLVYLFAPMSLLVGVYLFAQFAPIAAFQLPLVGW